MQDKNQQQQQQKQEKKPEQKKEMQQEMEKGDKDVEKKAVPTSSSSSSSSLSPPHSPSPSPSPPIVHPSQPEPEPEPHPDESESSLVNVRHMTKKDNVKCEITSSSSVQLDPNVNVTVESPKQSPKQSQAQSQSQQQSPQSIHSPTSSTFSSILHSASGSPVISAPTSPQQTHTQSTNGHDSDQDWQFTSPLMQTTRLSQPQQPQEPLSTSSSSSSSLSSRHLISSTKTDDKNYLLTIILPMGITKHDINMDIEVDGLHITSRDDPPMFPPHYMSVSSDADVDHLSAKSQIVDELHNIVVTIPKGTNNKTTINKRSIRIE